MEAPSVGGVQQLCGASVMGLPLWSMNSINCATAPFAYRNAFFRDAYLCPCNVKFLKLYSKNKNELKKYVNQYKKHGKTVDKAQKSV